MADHFDPLFRKSMQHAIVALGIFMIIVALSNGPLKATILEWQTEGRYAIGIEHGQAASVDIAASERNGIGIIEFTSTSDHTLLLSLPDTWKRREVRGARLEQVSPTETGLGYIRWTLPARATISMAAPETPRHLALHHPDNTPLKVRLSLVDLQNDTVERNIILVQSAKVDLW